MFEGERPELSCPCSAATECTRAGRVAMASRPAVQCSTNNVTQYERVNPHNIPSCILRMYPSISYDRYHVISLITSYRSRVIHIISHHGICSHVISCHVVSQYTISFKLLPSPPPKPYVIGHAAIYQALNPGTRIVMILTLYSFWCLICIFAKQT